MTQYGNYEEPGIVTDLTSSAATPTSGEAPNDLGFVGQADLANASNAADTGTVYQVTRASKAVEWFGPEDSSLLTTAIIDALVEGAYPVYAVAAPSTSVDNEVHDSASTTTVSFDNGPIREGAGDITVTLDGTEQDVNVVYDDVTTYSPDAGECYVNPVEPRVELNSTPGTSLTFSYDHFDYPAATDTLVNGAGDVIDLLAPVNENVDVVNDGNTTVAEMEQEYDLAILLGGADIYLDPSNYSPRYDDSRTQVVYPTRFKDGSSLVAAYAGFRASLGLESTPVNKYLTTNKRPIEDLNRAERGSLIDADVVPIADDSRGPRVVDDVTCVSDSNTDEQNLQYGFNRMVMDYIINTTRTNQRPFIGSLNSQTVRNVLEGMVNDQLTELAESQMVISSNINVLKEDRTTVGVEMEVDLAEPLRFIENTVTVTNGE
jgi:hypothetical protein